MPINYKQELEDAARNMILVHRPQTLIRMILRMMVQKIRIEHAGILLYDRLHNSYIVTISRGKPGAKLPAGFIRLDPSSPIIRFFVDSSFRSVFKKRVLLLSQVNTLLAKHDFFEGKEDLEKILLAIKFQMQSFDVIACVPSYYHDQLLGILLLGGKVDRNKFKREELEFFVALANDVAMALRNAFLFEERQNEVERNKRLFFETTLALSAAIDAKDHYTQGHTTRVKDYALAIGRRLMEDRDSAVHEKFLEHLHVASLLHDVGKIGIPEYILNKNGPLSEDERRKINEHPSIGAMILSPIKDLGEVTLAVKHHHERYDGRGYPDGLKQDGIPYMAAIIAVADAYDAMTTQRPYRQALNKQEAILELEYGMQSQFHPHIAKIMVGLTRRGEV